MRGIQQNLSKSVKQGAGSFGQGAMQIVKDETKGAGRDAVTSLGIELPTIGGNMPQGAQDALAVGQSDQGDWMEAEKIKKQDEQKMMGLKADLEQMMARARQDRVQREQQWSEQMEEKLASLRQQEERPALSAPSKKQGGPGGPAGGRLKQKQSKELGKGAKN
jgi:hypothetical protein